MRKQLLAKSTFHGTDKTVLEHTQDVVRSARHLFGSDGNSTRLGFKFAKMFGVRDVDRFLKNLLFAALLHDIGKANEEFQVAIEYANRKPRQYYQQAVRHEHVSAVLLVDHFASEMESNEDVDFAIVLAAVAGHHRKTGFDFFLERDLLTNASHNEFEELLAVCASHGISWSGNIANSIAPDDFEASIKDEVESYLADVEFRCKSDKDFASMSRAVSAGLILADTAGSALVKQEKPLDKWIDEVFDPAKIFDDKFVNDSIISPRIKQINDHCRSNGWPEFEWSKFQIAAGSMPSRGLLLAPCGSGKTMAAWRWLASQSIGGKRHAIFLYPTRATATEGFRDYVSWAPEADAALMHGSASYELQGMFGNPGESDSQKANQNYQPEQSRSLRSIAFWDKRFFSATVDQFFAFLQWDYSSLCLLPVLADAAVVVDEVHSFDDSMFASLIGLLENMKVPVLCMTATLPNTRRQALSEHLETLDAFTKEEFSDLRDVDSRPRYRVQIGDQDAAMNFGLEAFGNNQKVLWVVNTVDRAQALFQGIVEGSGEQDVYCYHSRFKLEDRKTRHSKVVDAFKSGSEKRAFAITTQVCEMGLDLDADVLITEQCPPSSLVQRMGRVNRSMRPRSDAGSVFIYEPEKALPYDENQLSGTKDLINLASAEDRISQASLNQMMLGIAERTEDPQSLASFLRGGFITVGSYRDIEEHTKRAILDTDLGDATAAQKAFEPLDGFILPVPRRFPTMPSKPPLPSWISVAPKSHYRPATGFHNEAISTTDEVVVPGEDNQWMII